MDRDEPIDSNSSDLTKAQKEILNSKKSLRKIEAKLDLMKNWQLNEKPGNRKTSQSFSDKRKDTKLINFINTGTREDISIPNYDKKFNPASIIMTKSNEKLSDSYDSYKRHSNVDYTILSNSERTNVLSRIQNKIDHQRKNQSFDSIGKLKGNSNRKTTTTTGISNIRGFCVEDKKVKSKKQTMKNKPNSKIESKLVDNSITPASWKISKNQIKSHLNQIKNIEPKSKIYSTTENVNVNNSQNFLSKEAINIVHDMLPDKQFNIDQSPYYFERKTVKRAVSAHDISKPKLENKKSIHYDPNKIRDYIKRQKVERRMAKNKEKSANETSIRNIKRKLVELDKWREKQFQLDKISKGSRDSKDQMVPIKKVGNVQNFQKVNTKNSFNSNSLNLNKCKSVEKNGKSKDIMSIAEYDEQDTCNLVIDKNCNVQKKNIPKVFINDPIDSFSLLDDKISVIMKEITELKEYNKNITKNFKTNSNSKFNGYSAPSARKNFQKNKNVKKRNDTIVGDAMSKNKGKYQMCKPKVSYNKDKKGSVNSYRNMISKTREKTKLSDNRKFFSDDLSCRKDRNKQKDIMNNRIDIINKLRSYNNLNKSLDYTRSKLSSSDKFKFISIVPNFGNTNFNMLKAYSLSKTENEFEFENIEKYQDNYSDISDDKNNSNALLDQFRNKNTRINKKYSPNALEAKFRNELNHLESIEQSTKHVDEIERVNSLLKSKNGDFPVENFTNILNEQQIQHDLRMKILESNLEKVNKNVTCIDDLKIDDSDAMVSPTLANRRQSLNTSFSSFNNSISRQYPYQEDSKLNLNEKFFPKDTGRKFCLNASFIEEIHPNLILEEMAHLKQENVPHKKLMKREYKSESEVFNENVAFPFANMKKSAIFSSKDDKENENRIKPPKTTSVSYTSVNMNVCPEMLSSVKYNKPTTTALENQHVFSSFRNLLHKVKRDDGDGEKVFQGEKMDGQQTESKKIETQSDDTIIMNNFIKSDENEFNVIGSNSTYVEVSDNSDNVLINHISKSPRNLESNLYNENNDILNFYNGYKEEPNLPSTLDNYQSIDNKFVFENFDTVNIEDDGHAFQVEKDLFVEDEIQSHDSLNESIKIKKELDVNKSENFQPDSDSVSIYDENFFDGNCQQFFAEAADRDQGFQNKREDGTLSSISTEHAYRNDSLASNENYDEIEQCIRNKIEKNKQYLAKFNQKTGHLSDSESSVKLKSSILSAEDLSKRLFEITNKESKEDVDPVVEPKKVINEIPDTPRYNTEPEETEIVDYFPPEYLNDVEKTFFSADVNADVYHELDDEGSNDEVEDLRQIEKDKARHNNVIMLNSMEPVDGTIFDVPHSVDSVNEIIDIVVQYLYTQLPVKFTEDDIFYDENTQHLEAIHRQINDLWMLSDSKDSSQESDEVIKSYNNLVIGLACCQFSNEYNRFNHKSQLNQFMINRIRGNVLNSLRLTDTEKKLGYSFINKMKNRRKFFRFNISRVDCLVTDHFINETERWTQFNKEKNMVISTVNDSIVSYLVADLVNELRLIYRR